MKLRAVLFDMDGVLVNSEPRHGATCEEISRMISHGRLGRKETHTIGTSTDDMYAHALKLAGEEGDPKELSRMHFAMTLERILTELPVADERVIKLLESVKAMGLTIALVSSSPRYFMQPILDRYDFMPYFTDTVAGDEVKRMKPDPEPYVTMLTRLGLKSGEAVAVEDSRTGSLAAKAAGLYCIGFVNPDSGNQDLSATDVLTDTYEGIFKCIAARAAE